MYRVRSWSRGRMFLGIVLMALPVVASGCLSMDRMDIVSTAENTATLSTLVAAVQAADLVDTLKEPGPFTVFAPTNEAFAALPTGALDNLLKPENRDQLVTVLKGHVVAGEFLSSDLHDGQVLTDLNGNPLAVHIAGGVVTVGGSKVVQADVLCSNGVVHVIDAVILPPT
jgi:uncharacterized surface protein with fasciclin (FAS1) repeats